MWNEETFSLRVLTIAHEFLLSGRSSLVGKHRMQIDGKLPHHVWMVLRDVSRARAKLN